MENHLLLMPLTLLVSWLIFSTSRVFYNIYLHPLRRFPGPLAARASTWWMAYIEVWKHESMPDALFRLHAQYGDVLRVGPNQLHFSNPSAYYDIYSRRWDKAKVLYEIFGEDSSSFGLLNYADAKQRKDVLQPMFSRRAILSMQSLIWENMNHLTSLMAKRNAEGKSSDMLYAFRAFAMDTITTFCFAKSVDAMDEPDFAAPIIIAMDSSIPALPIFRHFPPIKNLVLSFPPWLALKASPEIAGLHRMQTLLSEKIKEVTENPSNLKDAAYSTIFHTLLDPDAQKGHPMPNAKNLFEEGLTLLFAAGLTVGDTLMITHFHILTHPSLYERLKTEVRNIWPNIDSRPAFESLEALPLLTGTLKEGLRFSHGVTSPLLRVVPATGATIAGDSIPGGTLVGMSACFVHNSSSVFENSDEFRPERWLGDDAKGLDQFLVAFSKGPRSCLGINLAWCEMYIALATMLRRFDMKIDGTKAEDLIWRDCFTPYFGCGHLRVWCKPVEG